MSSPNSSPRCIMLVDDNELTNMIHQSLLRNFFSTESICVHSSPETALQWLESTRRTGGKLPDLILLDIEMPGMTGWDLLEEIRQRRIPVKVCMLSSSIAKEDVERQHDFEEVLEYFSKPLAEKHIPQILSMAER